ncbi:MAG: sulfite exporter TauE/SafE family protein [Clostridia bacterium]|nr:sulfite exporter TauE/SafE family protein [Clostridia bacterium]
MRQKTWRVEGMHCPHCETAILRAVCGVKGLQDPRADYRKGQLTAQWDEKGETLAELSRRISEAGYTLKGESAKDVWLKALLILLTAAGAFCLFAFTPLQSALGASSAAEAGMGLGALFLVGLTTSLHCVAMCGGINLAQSAVQAQEKRSVVRTNLLYNLGRVISYTLTGAIVGALGSAFKLSASAQAGIQGIAAVFMLLMALNLLDASPLRGRLPLFSVKLRGGLLRGGAHSSLWIGLINGLMPCGPLQAMQVYALATGSWWMGALSMLCFSLGTVPLMLGFGLVSGKLNRRYARPMRWTSGILVLIMSMAMTANALSLSGVSLGGAGDGTIRARAADGVQLVETELDWHGYPAFTVKKGIPVRWVMHAEKLNNCNHEIVIPSLNITWTLEKGDNVIEFTPDTAGEIPYTCWMGMIRSAITVTN